MKPYETGFSLRVKFFVPQEAEVWGQGFSHFFSYLPFLYQLHPRGACWRLSNPPIDTPWMLLLPSYLPSFLPSRLSNRRGINQYQLALLARLAQISAAGLKEVLFRTQVQCSKKAPGKWLQNIQQQANPFVMLFRFPASPQSPSPPKALWNDLLKSWQLHGLLRERLEDAPRDRLGKGFCGWEALLRLGKGGKRWWRSRYWGCFGGILGSFFLFLYFSLG